MVNTWYTESLPKSATTPLYKAWRQYGEKNFSMRILAMTTEEQKYRDVSDYIEQYDSYKNGYNPCKPSSRARPTGKVHPNSRAVDAYTIDGEFIKSFDSLGECCQFIGVAKQTVIGVLQGKFKQTKSVVFTERGEAPQHLGESYYTGEVYGLNKEGEVTVYDCQLDAAKALRLNGACDVSRSLHSKPEQKLSVCGTYLFKRREEIDNFVPSKPGRRWATK